MYIPLVETSKEIVLVSFSNVPFMFSDFIKGLISLFPIVLVFFSMSTFKEKESFPCQCSYQSFTSCLS